MPTVPDGALLKNTVLWQKLRHQLSLRLSARQNSHFTGFLRLPTQYEALAGPVCASLRAGGAPGRIEIAVLGCSNGAEAYTIASVLRRRHPDLQFRIRGFDIDAACIEQAAAAAYDAEAIYNNRIITEEFVAFTFDRHGDRYTVKPHIREHVSFGLGNVLDLGLAATVGSADVVFAQNFLFHMSPALARQALDNISGLLRPGSALFIDGVDLGLRHRFVRARKLAPLPYEVEQIHNEARRARSVGWPYEYWGLEPFLTYRRDWQGRYATVFVAR